MTKNTPVNHAMLPEKRIAMATLLAMHEAKVSLPARDVVQRYRASPARSTQKALEAFFTSDDDTLTSLLLERASQHMKSLRKTTDVDFMRDHPVLAALWRADIAAPVFSGGNAGQSRIVPAKPATTKELLAKLNALYKKRSLTPLKSWKGSRKELEKKIDQQTKMIERDIPPFPVLPTAVAKGAYKSTQEAIKKTGHSERGKSRKQEKLDAKKQRIVARAVSGEPNRFRIETRSDGTKRATIDTQVMDERKKSPSGDVLTLARLAKEEGGDPKQWRMKARKRHAELKKYEVGKHMYLPKHRDQVLAIMTQDRRKK